MLKVEARTDMLNLQLCIIIIGDYYFTFRLICFHRGQIKSSFYDVQMYEFNPKVFHPCVHHVYTNERFVLHFLCWFTRFPCDTWLAVILWSKLSSNLQAYCDALNTVSCATLFPDVTAKPCFTIVCFKPIRWIN